MIVEGDAENILIPTLAHLIDRDYTEHAVSIVNVGGVGLHRYARIFRRKQSENAKKHRLLDIPVACVTDMDVMPNCAPRILGKLKEGDTWPEISRQRRWRAKRDFLPDDQLKTHRGDKEAKATGQRVKTFVSEEWTFEYDLALGRKDKEGRFSARFAEDVFIAACLADEDDKINAGAKTVEIVEAEARIEFASLRQEADSQFASWKKAGEEGNGYTVEEVLASKIYARFAKDGVPKTIAAQYMASRLQGKCDKGELTSADLRAGLPKYLVDAIDYVTAAAAKTAELSEGDK
jgi:putative ATP-dependent endonuclease of OLD family